MFITPMLAASMPKTPVTIHPGVFLVEEKYDGHRLVTHVDSDHRVAAWSRYGLERVLPVHVVNAIARLSPGIYDGELIVPGKRSYGVTELVNGSELVYTVFDVLELLGTSTIASTYMQRRAYLEEMSRHRLFNADGIQLAEVTPVDSADDVRRYLDAVWKRDGEGLILKRLGARYVPGKRPKDAWIKIKALRSAVLTVIGFIPSKGQINNRGPYATVALRDDEGHETTVKTLNDAECRRFEEEAPRLPEIDEFSLGRVCPDHPAIGRKLRIEYQERTPDGNYRHPRWDRWHTTDDEE